MFKESGEELSYGNRHYEPDRIMGSGILFKYTENMKRFWLKTYEFMSTKGVNCDQYAMSTVLLNETIRNSINIKLLSFNWNFGMMKIDSSGNFNYIENCYHSSLPMNAKVRFVHGMQNLCSILNGKNDEFINETRVFFSPGECNTTEKKTTVKSGQLNFEKAVYPCNKTKINWQRFSDLPRNSIFWPYRKFCKE